MATIYELLNINTNFIQGFSLLAQQVVDKSLRDKQREMVRTLKNVQKNLFADPQQPAIATTLDELLNRVRCVVGGKNADFSSAELRFISYNLYSFTDDTSMLDCVISLMDNSWRNSYINGILFSLLSGWNDILREYREKIAVLLMEKLKLYNGYNVTYNSLKEHFDLLENEGPLRTAWLALKKESLFDITSIFCLKQNTFAWSYYSDVILHYYEKQPLDVCIRFIPEIIKSHNLDRTKKLLFANLIARIDREGDAMMQSNISKLAEHYLGDITLDTTWSAFPFAKKEDVEKLRKAKELVNQWITRKVIEIFFDVCIQDPSRKVFWTGLVKEIQSFRILGSEYVDKKLLNDGRLGEMYRHYFLKTYQTKNPTAALAFYIHGKIFVEFSDIGALYVYNPDNERVSFLYDKLRNCYSGNITVDLKDTSLPSLYQSNNYEEGRLPHIVGTWQNKLKEWMRKMLDREDRFSPFSVRVGSWNQLKQKEDAITNDKPTECVRRTATVEKESKIVPPVKKGAKITINRGFCPIKIDSSKDLFYGKCMIVAKEDGYYLFNLKNGRQDFLTGYDCREENNGSIYVFKGCYGELQAKHSFNGYTVTIGNLKLLNTNMVLFSGKNAEKRISLL